VLRLFGDGSAETVATVAERLNQLNAERQNAEALILREIDERLAAEPSLLEQPALVLEGVGWHRGVVGIVAGRLLERYHRPVLVISCEGNEAQGSGRSIPAFHLLNALDAIHNEAPHLLHRYGGHAVAVGLALDRGNIAELRQRLVALASARLAPGDLAPQLELDSAIRFGEMDDKLMEELARLAPHGLGNPAPLLGARDLELLGRPRIYKERHLGLRLRQDGIIMDAVGWRLAGLATGLGHGSRLALAFHPERNNFSGGPPLRLVLRDLKIQSPISN